MSLWEVTDRGPGRADRQSESGWQRGRSGIKGQEGGRKRRKGPRGEEGETVTALLLLASSLT